MYTLNVNRMFDNFFNDDRSTRVTRGGSNIHIALPGFSKEDINIDVEGNNLIISAEVDSYDENPFRRSFVKTYLIPSNIDPNSIKATLDRGVLTLDMSESKVTRKISVL